VFRIWVLVFGLVGAQMGWVMRPFIGDPTKPFTFFRQRESNFFQDVMRKTSELLSWDGNARNRDRDRDRDRDRNRDGGYGNSQSSRPSAVEPLNGR
jgi:hypothetical protein